MLIGTVTSYRLGHDVARLWVVETMSLSEKQKLLPLLLLSLLEYLDQQNFKVTLGEAWRPPETAVIYEREGKGISASLHCSRLAIDLNLFKDGKYLTDFESYLIAGLFWESLATLDYKTCWGGRFTRPDCDHFSIEHLGVK